VQLRETLLKVGARIIWHGRSMTFQMVEVMTCGMIQQILAAIGVAVGRCTIIEANLLMGVTAIVPHPGNVFRDKPVAAAYVLNGFGKSIGLMQVEELGQLETPILLTNTLSVGTYGNALIRRAIAANPDIGWRTTTVNPVVCKCNDGFLNDIQASPRPMQWPRLMPWVLIDPRNRPGMTNRAASIGDP
jgi:L-aminopeptidase/D-esterase-like protein